MIRVQLSKDSQCGFLTPTVGEDFKPNIISYPNYLRGVHKYLTYQHRLQKGPGAAWLIDIPFVVEQFIVHL